MTREKQIAIASCAYGSKGSSIDFEIGAKWADTNPKSPWISVKDDLPCNNPNNIHFGFTNNILATDGKNIFIMHMKKCKDGKYIWCSGNDNVDLSHPITHWMPIPKLPKFSN